MGTSTPAMFTVEGCCSIWATAPMAFWVVQSLGSLDAVIFGYSLLAGCAAEAEIEFDETLEIDTSL